MIARCGCNASGSGCAVKGAVGRVQPGTRYLLQIGRERRDFGLLCVNFSFVASLFQERLLLFRKSPSDLYLDSMAVPAMSNQLASPRETLASTGRDLRARVLIADKNSIMRAGLKDVLLRDGRFDVIGTVATGKEFIETLAKRPVDIGIIGWALPDMVGGDVVTAVKRRQSDTRIVIYTGESVNDVLKPAIRAGAWGFISKSDEPEVLIETVAAVSRGRLCFPFVDIETLNHDPLDMLTARERELLGALANGWSNLQIAARIGISRNTVKYHLKNLYDKLGVNNRAMAVALFMSKSG